MNEKKFNRQVDRNLAGKFYEQKGMIDEAIKLYEANIEEEFIGNFPYDRLAVIYRKQKSREDEIRVLKKAIQVFMQLDAQRGDVNPKLENFRKRLMKISETQ